MSCLTKRSAVGAVVSLALACVVVSAMGCTGSSVSREQTEEIDTVFRTGSSRISEITSFITALEDFDFENAGFLDNAVSAVTASRDAARELQASIDGLSGFDYDGDLEPLGTYIQEYAAAALEAVGELEGVYAGLLDILQAIEPVLREEAVITQLDEPGSDAELLERLTRLRDALDPSLAALAEIEVPTLLIEYKSLLEEIFTLLRKTVGDLIAVVGGTSSNIDMENNPDFQRMQELMIEYQPLVQRLYESLAITRMDALVEKVELEINRLYLEESG